MEGKFCLEPPPDAGQNVASAFSSLLDVSGPDIPVGIKAEVARNMASNFHLFMV